MREWFVRRQWLCQDMGTPVSSVIASRVTKPRSGQRAPSAVSSSSPESSASNVSSGSSTPERKVRPVRRLSLTLNKNTQAQDPTYHDEKAHSAQAERIPLTQEWVAAEWKVLVSHLHNTRPDLVSIFAKYTPYIIGENVVGLCVGSALEQDRITKSKKVIERYYQHKSGQAAVTLRIEVDATLATVSSKRGSQTQDTLQRVLQEYPLVGDLLSMLRIEKP